MPLDRKQQQQKGMIILFPRITLTHLLCQNQNCEKLCFPVDFYTTKFKAQRTRGAADQAMELVRRGREKQKILPLAREVHLTTMYVTQR